MDRNLALEVVRVTEAAALFASRHMGRGDEKSAFGSAVDAMRQAFSSVAINGRVVIGRLDNGDGSVPGEIRVGCNSNGNEADVIVDSLDGKTTCAMGGQNAISAVAIGNKDSFFNAPPVYMEKIAVGESAKGVIDITEPPDINIKRLARAKDKYIEDVTVCILDRERHKGLIDTIRKVGARIILIRDGDISGAIAAAMEDRPIDILMGIGGAMEGVLAAAAIKCLGGDIQARFVYSNDEDRERVLQSGIKDPDGIYTISDLASGDDIMFSTTGVTDGELLEGVRFFSGGATTNSIVMRSKTRTLRYITAVHRFDSKPMYE